MDWGKVRGGRVMIVKFLIYFTPLAAGVVMVFFMFKPIFARRPKHAQPLALNPGSEPLLYAFIHKICESVGAPSPKRIDLDCQLNASAGFRRGLASFLGNDMVLTLGLPLVANLNARELAGVVAHEFGHFSQGMGMRLSYVIRSVNFWFARVAYERDDWDEALATWAEQARDGRVMLVLAVVRLGVWLSRTVLKILMFTGHLIGGFMLRQMEYNADQYEIKMSGSDVFEVTQRKLATLDATLQGCYQQMQGNWKKYRTLPDNLPESLRRLHNEMPPKIHEQINDRLGLLKTGPFDSHPSPGDRIRAARKAADPGIFHDERPSTALFSSFDHPAKFVTLLHYTDNLRIPITQQMLTPVQPEQKVGVLIAKPTAASNEICDAYFFKVLPMLLPFRLATPVATANWETDAMELNQLSASIKQISEQLADCAQKYDHATEQLLTARMAHCLIAGGMEVDPATLGTVEATIETATSAETKAVQTREVLRDSLKEVASAMIRRLQLGLGLALASAGNQGSDTPPEQGVAALAAQLTADADVYLKRKEVADAVATLNRVKGMKFSRGGSPALARALEKQTQVVASLAAQYFAKPVEETPAPKTGLRLQTVPKMLGAMVSSEVTAIETETQDWLAGYEKRLEILTRAAMSAEGVAG